MADYKKYEAVNKKELREMYNSTVADVLPSGGELAGIDVASLNRFSLPTQFFYKRKIDEMMKLSGFKKGDHILEVGSSNAHITFVFASFGLKITAVDLSPKCIAYAKYIAKSKDIKDVDFYVADAEDLSIFPDNFFDGAVSFSVIRYVPNPQKALNEIYRVVKPGSSVVVDFPNKFCPWFKIIKKIIGRKEHIHDHLFTESRVKALFADAGFRNIKTSFLLYMYKNAPLLVYYLSKGIGGLLEKIPGVNKTAAIIMCRGIK